MNGLSSKGPPLVISQKERMPVLSAGKTQIDCRAMFRKQLNWFLGFFSPNSLPTAELCYSGISGGRDTVFPIV